MLALICVLVRSRKARLWVCESHSRVACGLGFFGLFVDIHILVVGYCDNFLMAFAGE